jgi:hypothetical protein
VDILAGRIRVVSHFILNFLAGWHRFPNLWERSDLETDVKSDLNDAKDLLALLTRRREHQ